jgi:hypothetical protein
LRLPTAPRNQALYGVVDGSVYARSSILLAAIVYKTQKIEAINTVQKICWVAYIYT